MSMQRRDFIKWLSVLSTIPLAPPVWANTKEDFTVYGAPSLPSLIIAVAASQGELAKQANVALNIWRTPDQLRAGVASGQFKTMMSPSNVGVNLRNQGQNVGLVNILTNGIIQLISKKPLSQLSDLIGKKIIVPFKNDMPDIVLQALLNKLNIDITKIEITYLATPTEAVGIFLSKDFDGVLLPEPMASAAILRGKSMGIDVTRSLDITQTWGQVFNTKAMIPQAGIIANVDYYNAHQAQFELFHQDLINALTWIQQNPQKTAQIGKDYLAAPEPALVQSLSHANLTVTKASDIKNEIMQFYEELIRFNPKLLGGKLPEDAFFLA